MKIANQFYQKALRASPKAIEYLKPEASLARLQKNFLLVLLLMDGKT